MEINEMEEFVKKYCDADMTEHECRMYWYYYKMGKVHRGMRGYE